VRRKVPYDHSIRLAEHLWQVSRWRDSAPADGRLRGSSLDFTLIRIHEYLRGIKLTEIELIFYIINLFVRITSPLLVKLSLWAGQNDRLTVDPIPNSSN